MQGCDRTISPYQPKDSSHGSLLGGYCYAVWCSAADTRHKLLDRIVSGARFLTGGVFQCDIVHRRTLAV